ncbi:Ltp family lipoprotein [Lactococcus cremoris]|uniref:Ltp family lipoprotein n=2 Tax=Lactococcus lactis subsp. cremoris TaxID=1359 RepID=UPI0022019F4A|nr:Ltp family lipoprotein [Lactococcus cremoris]UXV60206.1 Ltp family lipoprotein [Lactococcus cremoris]
MSPFFGVIGILAFLIGLVMLFINLVKKKSKKQPLIILIVGFLLFIIGVAIPSNSDAKESKKSTTSVSTTETKKEETKVTSQSSTKKPKPSSKVLTAQEKAIDGLTGNSLAHAISYLYTGHMSKQGLYDQLTSEYGSQMTVDEANNAINRIDPLVNWNNLAILSAKSYRETGNLTGQALIDQLTSEYGSRFTPEQAQYGVLHIDDEVKSSAIWN